jgi:hypothetical protein
MYFYLYYLKKTLCSVVNQYVDAFVKPSSVAISQRRHMGTLKAQS